MHLMVHISTIVAIDAAPSTALLSSYAPNRRIQFCHRLNSHLFSVKSTALLSSFSL